MKTSWRLLFRQLRHLANILRNTMAVPDTGVITGSGRSLFLSQTHFHIFGVFFPLAVPRITAAVDVVVDLYRSVNLTGHAVAPTRTGNDVTTVARSRDHDDGYVSMSARRWPKVFEQEAETLQR